MKIIGHRGINQPNKKDKPYQNTIEAIEYSLKYSDGVEIDLFISKDGKCHVIHDNLISKHSNYSKGRITSLTAHEIKGRYVGKDKKFHIPEFREVQEIFKKKDKLLNIEIKQKDIQDHVLKEINQSKIDKGKLIISSFNHKNLQDLRKKDKDLKLGILFYKKEENYEEYILKLAEKLGNYVFIPEKECGFERMNNSNVEKYYWTFREKDKSHLKRINKYPNANIITDFPELYRK